MLSENVTTKVPMPKIREKEIIRMENSEVREVFDLLDNTSSFDTDKQNSYNNNNTKIRDNAIITLLLGTGIRVSECVGLNIRDINFDNKSFLVTRKGEKESILYLNDDIIIALQNYLSIRNDRLELKNIDPNTVDAFFLSLQNKRMTVRAVEIIVKKYTQMVNPIKRITPHKLRSTYGTALYRETNDIYVVAEVLGHKDINTTKKHYAAISEDIKKSAADKVNFKKNNDENV
jgi:site-specific recombinase XerD